MADTPRPWALKGTVVIACNCDWGCPCNFNAPPTTGQCEGGWTWNVQEGLFGDVRLDGLVFAVFVRWPGAIHQGNGEALVFVDERADTRQEEAIRTLVGGTVGGPWGILAWTWPTVHGVRRVRFEITLDGVHSRVRIPETLDVASTTIKNPVTGAEARPGIVLPEGLIVKRADLGSSTTLRLNGTLSMDHAGKYTAVGPFDYSGA